MTIVRIQESVTTALIFSSGEVICTGAKRYGNKVSTVSYRQRTVRKGAFVWKLTGGAAYCSLADFTQYRTISHTLQSPGLGERIRI